MNPHVYNNCVNLSSISDTLFQNNSTTNLTIDVQPLMWPPFMIYNEQLTNTENISIINYQWCGPLMVVMRIIAKQMNAKYNE